MPKGEKYTAILQMVHDAVYRIPPDVDVQSEVHLVLVTTAKKSKPFRHSERFTIV
ncbi:hypothetical protein [Sporosarcina sp. FSL K6-3457]|uniref:hypothetical protein n=1 Tax=Sporosarcina sp. FSL K6-3457 TaxID=2978204 RepID=UPI0030F88611